MTNSAEFVQSPLFQVNLMLWLVWSSRYSSIHPIFRERGFKLHSVGQPLTLSYPIQAKLRNANIDANQTAMPDILLRHDEQRVFIPIECKKQSFGKTSTKDVAQANCLLCSTGADIGQIIGVPASHDWFAHLNYVVAHSSQQLMLNTLQQLTIELQNAKAVPTASGSIGIHVKLNDGIYLEFCNDENMQHHTYEPFEGWFKVQNLDLNEPPEPFYLMPFDLSTGGADNIGNKFLEERIRSALVVLIMQRVQNDDFTLTENEVMQNAFEIWDYWKEDHLKTGLLRKAVRPYLKKIKLQLEKRGAKITYENRILSFNSLTIEVRKKIKNYIRSRSFKEGEIKYRSNLRKRDPRNFIYFQIAMMLKND